MKTRRKNDKNTKTMLRVPNDATGNEFLKQLRKYSAGGTRVWCRGRGARAAHSRTKYGNDYARGFDQQLPQELAEYFAVYIYKPTQVVISREYARQLHNQAYATTKELRRLEVIPALEAEVRRLEADRGELMKQRDVLQQEVQRLRTRVKGVDASKTIHIVVNIPPDGEVN